MREIASQSGQDGHNAMHASDGGKPKESVWARMLSVFERAVVLVMAGLLMIVVAISTAELAWLLLKDLSSVRELLLDVEEMFELFGFVLLILIGVELMTTLKIYAREGTIHMEVVLEVALIAVAQKVIVLNTAATDGLSLLGLAALIVALAAAYWWVRTARQSSRTAS